MSDQHGTQIADLKARMTAVEYGLKEMRSDVKAIRSKTDRASGVVALFWVLIPAAAAGFLGWIVGKP